MERDDYKEFSLWSQDQNKDSDLFQREPPFLNSLLSSLPNDSSYFYYPISSDFQGFFHQNSVLEENNDDNIEPKTPSVVDYGHDDRITKMDQDHHRPTNMASLMSKIQNMGINDDRNNDKNNSISITLILHSMTEDEDNSQILQHLLNYISTSDQKVEFTLALKNNIVPLTKNHYAGHVINKCLTIFPTSLSTEILNAVASTCLETATHSVGCCVLQKFLNNANLESLTQLLREITLSATFLAKHHYGNYVVQFVIRKKNIELNAAIAQQLAGHFVELCRNKFSSHVVQVLLENSNVRIVGSIIQEMVNSPEFLDVLQCPFGNYVVQTGLEFSVGSDVHETFVNRIISHEVYIQSHLFGKNVLASARRYKLKLQA